MVFVILQKQVWEGKSAEEKKEVANVELNRKSLEVASDFDPSPAVHASDNMKLSENGSVVTTVDAPKGAKSVVPEKRIVANGVVNGC